MILYNLFLDDFLVLKLFPGDPILDPPDFRDPLFKKCDRVSLNRGRGKRGPHVVKYVDRIICCNHPFTVL